MIKRLIDFALNRRLLIGLLSVAVAIFGYYSWTQLALEAYPDIADVTSQVITQAPGFAAEEVEQQITVPLERELNGTPGLIVMRSKSTFGLSLITLVFRDGVDDYWARQRITERIQNVDLPHGAAPQLDPLTSPIGEIYRYTLESDSKNLRELSEIQRWTVIPALKQIAGVADVANFGGLTTQFQLELDPAQLMRFNLSLKNVTEAIEANSYNAGGSVLTRGELGYVVRGIGLIQSLDDMGNIVVTQRNGSPVFIRDLGKLRLSSQERRGILGKDERGDTLSGIVLLLRGENPSRVLDGVHAKVAELNKSLLSSDVQIVPYLDRSHLVNATVNKVSHTILEGIGLVLIVLILFLGSPRSALIVGVTIPFAMLVAFVLMNLTKIPANLLSLGAIDFGIIVDASIVMTEAILRRREAKPGETLTPADVRDASLQVARPIFFATLVIIAAYLPLFAFQRVEAKLFTPMVFAVGYAQLGALIFALTVIPGLAYFAYRKPMRLFHNPLIGWLEAGYQRMLRQMLDRPRRVMGLTAAVAVAVVGLGSTVGREFLPELDEGSIWLQVQMPAGISLETATGMAGELRRAVREFPEVSYVVTQLGRNDDGTDPWTPSHIEASVGLHPYDSWPSRTGKQDLIRRMAERFESMPGFQIGFSQPMIDGVNDKIAGAHSQLVVKVYGNAFKELRRISREIVDVLKATPGATDVAIDQEPPLPQIAIKVDREAAARYGINVSDVADLIEKGIGGAPVSQIFIGERRYDATVRFSPASRATPDAIGDLTLTSSDGALIPLSQVAKVVLQSGESTITREMNQRHLTVKLNYRDRDLSSLLADARQRISENVKFDSSAYRIEWGGQFENQRRAERRLMLIMGLVLGLMVILLYPEFGLLRQVLLILGIVPLATLGGLIAIHATGMTLNIASSVGFIALFGVAIMNGVVMVANLNRVRAGGMPLYEAVLFGARERLRPVLLTATVATVGMLPAALATGIGSDVQRGVGTVVAGGLMTATLLTLFVIPTFYFVLEPWALQRASAKAAHGAAEAQS
ncbi:MAG TPA: CusA/CzcA family heavy metal efflux RND transporter [Xanthobacteraceae bacterium]|nr:CusA/CzcA family heavy metal efflux RND transporter [Xanthobacteraceae bacterium]